MIIIGLGTGRCGTQSLAHLLNMQTGVIVTHERNPQKIHWEGTWHSVEKNLKEFEKILNGEKKRLHISHKRGNENVKKKIDSDYKIEVVGDIGFYYLPYVEKIISYTNNIKFICMQRNKEETVKSYLKWTTDRKLEGIARWFGIRGDLNHWSLHKKGIWEKSYWDACYPKYERDSKEDAIKMYWDEYYKKATVYEKKYENKFKIFDIKQLNKKNGQEEILTYIGISKKYMIFNVGIKSNPNESKK